MEVMAVVAGMAAVVKGVMEVKEVMDLQQRKEGGGEGNAKENRKIHIIEVGYT